MYGIDITDKNLPQEIARDDVAISFKKGCYLGQETVARIDALGHVNRRLTRLEFPAVGIPAPGDVAMSQGEEAGRITSAARSPQGNVALALAYLKTGHDAPGTTVQCGDQAGVVARPA